MFLKRVQKQLLHLRSTLTTENISGTLFVFCLSLKMFCIPFSDILTWKCINHTYLVEDYSLNTSRKPYFLVFYSCFGLQNINRTFFHTLKLLNMLRSTLFFAVKLVIRSVEPVLLHSNLKKPPSYFDFSALRTDDPFYCLFLDFQTINTYTDRYFFVGIVKKQNCYLLRNTLTSKNISCTLFMTWFSLNIFFLQFSGVLT